MSLIDHIDMTSYRWDFPFSTSDSFELHIKDIVSTRRG